jgi:aryl-alcohol dehydrogenase-like predicted oxidoreductase
MDYGIKGQKKPGLQEAVRNLDFATQNGVCAIDTAQAYGTAEKVTGEFLKRRTISRDKLFISTKLLPNILDNVSPKQYKEVIRKHLEGSLSVLNLKYVDAYMLHSARYAYDPEILDALAAVGKEGLTRKVGVSVYDPDEADACFHHGEIGYIQIPYSIFDHRMKEQGIFLKAHESGVSIGTRSAFIQGLITMEESEVPPFLENAKPILQRLDRLVRETGYSRVELAMGYVKKEKEISHLVFGIDSMEQLKEDIHAFQNEIPNDVFRRMEKEFHGLAADVVMPSLWKKGREDEVSGDGTGAVRFHQTA